MADWGPIFPGASATASIPQRLLVQAAQGDELKQQVLVVFWGAKFHRRKTHVCNCVYRYMFYIYICFLYIYVIYIDICYIYMIFRISILIYMNLYMLLDGNMMDIEPEG